MSVLQIARGYFSIQGHIVPVLCFLCLVSCSKIQPPDRPFSVEAIPPSPNYALADSWSCLPTKDDPADLSPPDVEPENQATAETDVFFIHPTTFMESNSWNGDLADQSLNQATDDRAILHQASIFNRAGRVYAPRYRQMVYGGFLTEDQASKGQALALAYEDVKAAFEHYLRTWNNGRPFIIAGHSQGAFHAIHLLKDYIDDKPLRTQLVAAYVPGWPLKAGTYATLPPCNSPTQTGCVTSWCSWREGVEPPTLNTFYADAIVTNPLNWRSDGTPAADSMHMGFLDGKYQKIRKSALHARQYGGVLWVSNPIPVVPIKNFHVGDFNLFWMDVRHNAEERVKAYLQRQLQD